MIKSLFPWSKGQASPGPRRSINANDEDDTAERRRLALERTFQAVHEQEEEMRAAAERIRTELDVLRRE